MAVPKFLTIAEQAADYLSDELLRGRWTGTIPGMNQLAPELGVNAKTAEAALRLLERRGLLEGQGAGRRRRIAVPANLSPPALRLAILDYEPIAQTEEWSVAMQQLLTNKGHSAFFAEKSLIELGMDVGRIALLVDKTPADAWVVCSASREVLGWFAEQERPAFALFGRRSALPIAGVGPDKASAFRAAVKRLLALGHHRIVLLERESRRAGGVGSPESAMLEEIAAHGFPTGSYNLPDWDDTPEALRKVLDELFRVTPPTALIVDEAFLFHAVKEHLAQQGMVAPKHLSLVCTDPDPSFAWCKPSVACIHWDHHPVVRRILGWANNVARGKEDMRQTFTKAEFVDGGTVGPLPAIR